MVLTGKTREMQESATPAKDSFMGKSVHHMGSAFFMPERRQLQYVTMLCQFLELV